MAIASTAIVWQDPIMNWAPYAVYNPQLWHWPEDWPLVNLSPTVEPFVVIGYAIVLLRPLLPGRCDPAATAGQACPWTRSSGAIRCVSLGVLILGHRFHHATRCWRVTLVRTGLYIYSQVIPFGSLFRGHDVPVPADLGIRLGHLRDDSRRHTLLPR